MARSLTRTCPSWMTKLCVRELHPEALSHTQIDMHTRQLLELGQLKSLSKPNVSGVMNSGP